MNSRDNIQIWFIRGAVVMVIVYMVFLTISLFSLQSKVDNLETNKLNNRVTLTIPVTPKERKPISFSYDTLTQVMVNDLIEQRMLIQSLQVQDSTTVK